MIDTTCIENASGVYLYGESEHIDTSYSQDKITSARNRI